MYCTNCGTQLPDQAVTCTNCGHPQQGGGAAAVGPVAGGRRTEGTAVASLILGILGLIACPLILSIPAIVLGNQAQDRIRQNPTTLDGEGMARAGMIMGWIGVGFAALGVLIFILAAAA